jgi:hypothetical protein
VGDELGVVIEVEVAKLRVLDRGYFDRWRSGVRTTSRSIALLLSGKPILRVRFARLHYVILTRRHTRRELLRPREAA